LIKVVEKYLILFNDESYEYWNSGKELTYK